MQGDPCLFPAGEDAGLGRHHLAELVPVFFEVSIFTGFTLLVLCANRSVETARLGARM